MTTLHPMRIAIAVLLVAAALSGPARPAVHAAALVASHAAVGMNPLDFDATLTGVTTPDKRPVDLMVTRDATTGSVQLTVSLTPAQAARVVSNSYEFSVPKSDLVINDRSRTASLDTHTHLGKYGRITVQWSWAAQPTKINIPADPCTPGVAATSITRIVAKYSATLALKFPCDKSVNATMSGTANVDSGVTPSTQSSSSGVKSIAYTMVTANHSTKTSQVTVMAMKAGSGALLFSVVLSSSTGATTGLTGETHFASDTSGQSSLAITSAGGGTTATLGYSGVLGTARLTFKAGPTGSMSISRPVRCIAPGASKTDLGKTVNMQMSPAMVSGPVNLTACQAAKTTFVASNPNKGIQGDTAEIMSTSLGSGSSPLPVITPPAIGTPPAGGSGSGAGGALSISNISPADGSTVPGSTPITMTVSAAPQDGQINIMLIGPTGPVQLPAPVFDSAKMTLTVTPSSPLAAGTYHLVVIVAGGMPATVSFTVS